MASGYFSPPSDHLDPSLFDGDRLRDSVRLPLTEAASSSLESEGLRRPDVWLHMWLTGSAISFQWSADRGNGDLDVQLGFDYQAFLAYNPEYENIDPYIMSDKVNRFLRENLWPKMASATFGTRTYEVTFFWNTLVGSDIDYIHPYAAYDLVKNEWVVRPPQLPQNPSELYPATWYSAADSDLIASQRLSESHAAVSQALAGLNVGTPGYINAHSQVNLIEAQSRSLYDEIHGGRSNAFDTGGHGYSDYSNFRWQYAKSNGTIDRLKEIRTPKAEDSAKSALETAIMWRTGTRYSG